MGESSLLWLRVAAGLYSLGLIDAIVTVLRRRESLFRVAIVAFGLGGIALSYYMYVVNKALPEQLASAFSGLYNLIYNKYFVDEIYDATVVGPIVAGSRTVLWRGIDQGLIDGIVNGVGTQSKGIGGVLRLLQSGNIRSYATWVAIGSVALLLIMGVAEGVGR